MASKSIDQLAAELGIRNMSGSRSEFWLDWNGQFVARCKHHQPGKAARIILMSIKKEWKGDVAAFIAHAKATSPAEAADLFRKQFPTMTHLHKPDVRPLPGRVVA